MSCEILTLNSLGIVVLKYVINKDTVLKERNRFFNTERLEGKNKIYFRFMFHCKKLKVIQCH